MAQSTGVHRQTYATLAGVVLVAGPRAEAAPLAGSRIPRRFSAVPKWNVRVDQLPPSLCAQLGNLVVSHCTGIPL